MKKTLLAFAALSVAGCATSSTGASSSTPADAFLAALAAQCGKAYAGRITANQPASTTPDAFEGKALVMHVRGCDDPAREIRVPFHVGDDHSRTWVVTRTTDGLRLKHDHRHEDGTADSVTMYGGDTRDSGSADRQEFYADSLTASLIAAARTNVWTLELHPGHMFVYALRREGATRRFRAEFDLASPVAEPPAPWGKR